MEAKFEKINSKTVEQYIQYRSEKMDTRTENWIPKLKKWIQ